MKLTLHQLARALCVIGELLDLERADYCFEGRFRFALSDEWSLVISADDAERLRLEACYSSRVRRTIWCRAVDTDRLSDLVLAAHSEVAALAA